MGKEWDSGRVERHFCLKAWHRQKFKGTNSLVWVSRQVCRITFLEPRNSKPDGDGQKAEQCMTCAHALFPLIQFHAPATRGDPRP